MNILIVLPTKFLCGERGLHDISYSQEYFAVTQIEQVTGKCEYEVEAQHEGLTPTVMGPICTSDSISDCSLTPKTQISSTPPRSSEEGYHQQRFAGISIESGVDEWQDCSAARQTLQSLRTSAIGSLEGKLLK